MADHYASITQPRFASCAAHPVHNLHCEACMTALRRTLTGPCACPDATTTRAEVYGAVTFSRCTRCGGVPRTPDAR